MLIIDIAGHIVTPNDMFNGTAVSHFSCVFHGNFTLYRNAYEGTTRRNLVCTKGSLSVH